MSSRNNQRKHLLIDQHYQVRFVVKFVLVVLLATLLSTGTAWFVSQQGIGGKSLAGLGRLVDLRQILAGALLISAGVTILTVGVIGTWVTLKETHRVIGPVRRLEEKFQEMAEGDFRYLESFRHDDVLKGLDDSVNIHLNNLGDLVRVLDMSLKDVIAGLRALEKGEGNREQNLLLIRKRIAEIDHYADAFRPR